MLAIGFGEEPGALSAAADQRGVIRQFLCCRIRYLVSYRRILALTNTCIRTINPNDFTVTNEFDLGSVVGLKANDLDRNSFVIELEGKEAAAKPIQYFYSAENRTEVLCALHKCWWKVKSERATRSDEPLISGEDSILGDEMPMAATEEPQTYYSVRRLRKSGSYNSTTLVVKPYGLEEVESRTGRTLQIYYYYNMSEMVCNKDAMFLYFTYSGRLKIFTMLESALELPNMLRELNQAIKGVGISVDRSKIEGLSERDREQSQNGKHSDDVVTYTETKLKDVVARRNAVQGSVTGAGAICSFDATKHSSRHGRPMPRQIQINEEYIVEKDSSGFQTVAYYRLNSIFSLVRGWNNSREFSIEFDDGTTRYYSSSTRDSVLAVLLDICHAVGNVRVVVLGESSRSLRILPRFVARLELGLLERSDASSFSEILFGARTMEYNLLSRLCKVLEQAAHAGSALTAARSGVGVDEVCRACVLFTSNIGYPGVTPDADPGLVSRCIVALMRCANTELIHSSNAEGVSTVNSQLLVMLLQTLCKIIPCVQGYKGFIEVQELNTRQLLVQLLNVPDDIVNYWALEVLKLLCCCPYAPRNVKQEFVNKSTLLTDEMVLAVTNLISVDPGEGDEGIYDETNTAAGSVDHIPLSPDKSQAGSSGRHSVGSSSSSGDEADLFTDVASPVPSGTQAQSPGRSRRSSSESVPSASRISLNMGGVFGPNSLVTMAAASMLESVLSSRRDTTPPEMVMAVMDRLGQRCEMLLHMLQTTSFVVLENAAILMFILLKHRPDVAPVLKEVALCEGLALKHFYNAVYSPSSTQRYISRFLVATWMSGDEKEGDMGKALLTRILPRGLVEFLKAPPVSRAQRAYLEELEEEYYTSSASLNVRKVSPIGLSAGAGTRNLSKSAELQLRMRRRISKVLKERVVDDEVFPQDGMVATLGGASSILGDLRGGTRDDADLNTSFGSVATVGVAVEQSYSSMCINNAADMDHPTLSPENWRMLFHMMIQNHRIPDLIWNESTRLELRKELETELRNYEREKRLRGGAQVAWNFQQFKVFYPSLRHEMQVGPIYVRHFLEADITFLRSIERPSHTELFERLFRRVVGNIDVDADLSILCARCLVRLYSVCADMIGPFDDTMLAVDILEQSEHLELQHCLFELLDQLSRVELNLHQMLDKNFVDLIIKYASLAHVNPDQIGNVLARNFEAKQALLIEQGTEDRQVDGDDDDESSEEEFGFDGYNGDLGGTWRDSIIASEMETFESFDGPDVGREGEEEDGGEREIATIRKENRAMWAPEDDACPRTWYVTPGGGVIPPPTHLQQGPYRVTELAKMYDEGEIDGDYIVAPVVSSTNEETDSNGVKETFEQMVDTGKWRPVKEYFQLRMQLLLPGKAIYSPADVSAKALNMLARVSLVHKAFDARGLPFYPTPVSRRIMSEPEHLTIFSQLLLSNDMQVVDDAATLLYNLLEHNATANSKLYLTGLFYFALRYTGSNFKALAKLLGVTHLNQSTHTIAAQVGHDLRPSQKSILASMLPESLINMLIEYGPDRFAEVFTGEHDTPEVIWNNEFRVHVFEMVSQHLGTFPAALRQFTMARYEYCPIPGLHFPELDKELYVNRYYLNNLCNEVQFPNWPIHEPLMLLRDTVERWRLEMAKGIPDKDISEAKNLLELSGSKIESTALRKAYRSLARKYHPDRNPAGREMFEKVQMAYELLSTVEMKDGDTDLSSVLLLIKTQNLVYKRYPSAVRDQKYPAYSLLLKVASIPSFPVKLVALDKRESHRHMKYKVNRKSLGFGRSGAVESSDLVGANGASVYLLYECAMLLYHTCSISPLNSRELVRTGCMDRLYHILCFSIEGVESCAKSAAAAGSHGVAEDSSYLMFSVCCKILVHSIKALTAVSMTEIGRQGILDLCPSFARTLYKILMMNESLPLAAESAIKLISRCCSMQALQRTFVESGCFWLLVPLLLAFDGTLEHANELSRQVSNDSYDEDKEDATAASTKRQSVPGERARRGSEYTGHAAVGFGEDQRETHNQNSCNMHAILAAQALGRLGGYMMMDLQSPDYPEVRAALSRLLTPSISRLLRNSRPWVLLESLNTNSETPTKIWNTGMRDELLVYVKQVNSVRRERLEREDAEADGATEEELRDLADVWGSKTELTASEGFRFSCLVNELFVGGVYVRIFNRSKGDVTEIDEPSAFCRQLLLYLCSHTEEPHPSLLGRNAKKASADIQGPGGQEERSDDEVIASFFNESRLKDPTLRAAHLDLAVFALKTLAETQNYIASDITDFPRGICAIFGILSRKYSAKQTATFIGATKLILELSEDRSFVKMASSPEVFTDNYCILQMLYTVCQTADESTSDHVWAMCHQFTSFSEGLDNLLAQGAVVRLLGCVFGVRGYASFFQNRENAAALMSKLSSHPHKGAETCRTLQQFLPLPLVKLLGDRQGQNAVRLFDETCENPELIWTKEMKGELRDVLSQILLTKLTDAHAAFAVPSPNCSPEKTDPPSKESPGADFVLQGNHQPSEAKKLRNIRSDYIVSYSRLAQEISVGHVYLKHFLKQPTFRLSNPVYTLEKVVELWNSVFSRLVPLKKAEYSLRESLLTLTAAALPFLRESISPTNAGGDSKSDDDSDLLRVPSVEKTGDVVEYKAGRHSYPTDASGGVHFIGEHDRVPVIIPDTQLLLLLTQAVGCIVRSESSIMTHLMSWGLTNTLCQCLRTCINHHMQRKSEASSSGGDGATSDAPIDGGGRKTSAGSAVQTSVSICITCTVDLLNLLVVRVEAVDDLAASSENVILCLKQVLDNGFAEDDKGARVDGEKNPFTRPLPPYTSAVLKLLGRIFQADMSMNLLYFVQAAINCNLPTILLDDIICAPIAAFEHMNLQLNGNSELTSNRNAQTIRLQAADVIKAILHADDEEYYTVALRIHLESHPAWRDFGYQSHGLYAIADQSIEKLVAIGNGHAAAPGRRSGSTRGSSAASNLRLREASSGSTRTSGDSPNIQQDCTPLAPDSPPRRSSSRGASSNSSSSQRNANSSHPHQRASTGAMTPSDPDYNSRGTTQDANQRPSFTTNSDVINFQRLSKGAAAAAAAASSASSASSSPNKAANEGDSKRVSFNPFDNEDDEELSAKGEPIQTGSALLKTDTGGNVIVETVDEVGPERASLDGEILSFPASATDEEAGDLSHHQQVMHRLSLSIEEQQSRERRSLLQSRSVASFSSSSPEREATPQTVPELYAKETSKMAQTDAVSETESPYHRRGNSVVFRTVIEKGPYGLGLDLARASDGGCLFLQYKTVSAAQGGPNLAEKAAPSLLQGDRISAVNGERWETFAETVKALRLSRGGSVEIELERTV